MTRLSIATEREATPSPAENGPEMVPHCGCNLLTAVGLGWLSLLAVGAAAKAAGLGWALAALTAVPGGAVLTLAIMAVACRLEDAMAARRGNVPSALDVSHPLT